MLFIFFFAFFCNVLCSYFFIIILSMGHSLQADQSLTSQLSIPLGLTQFLAQPISSNPLA